METPKLSLDVAPVTDYARKSAHFVRSLDTLIKASDLPLDVVISTTLAILMLRALKDNMPYETFNKAISEGMARAHTSVVLCDNLDTDSQQKLVDHFNEALKGN